MSISLIHGWATTSWLKRTSNCSSAGMSTGARPRTPFKAVKMRVPLHHAPGQGGIERRQCQGAVLVNFHQLAARAKQQHRSELRVNAAADDQLVAVQFDHGLDRHPEEVFLAGLGRHGGLNGAPGAAHGRRVRRFNCTPPTSVLWVMVSE